MNATGTMLPVTERIHVGHCCLGHDDVKDFNRFHEQSLVSNDSAILTDKRFQWGLDTVSTIRALTVYFKDRISLFVQRKNS